MKTAILIIMLLPLISNGQNQVIQLWDGEMPNYQDVGEKEIGSETADMEHYRLVINPTITVFLPSKKNRTGQALLVIPGGGYQAVVHRWEGTDIAKWLNANGIAAFVLKYRLPNAKHNIVSHKSPLLDASQAMKIIRTNSEKWNIDKDNIGVIGFSAGGHLASTLGTHYNRDGNSTRNKYSSISSRPDFMVLMYPVITMDTTFTHRGSRNNLLGPNPSQELIDYYSNEKQITKNTPPTFLVHTSDDAVVPVKNSIEFYLALQKNGVNSEMHIYEHGEHGFALANGKGSLKSWRNRCINWLENISKK